MTAIEDASQQVAQVREASLKQRRRVAEVRAREHVGAAGWAQTTHSINPLTVFNDQNTVI